VIRLLLLLLGTLSAQRPGRRMAGWYRDDDPDGTAGPGAGYPGGRYPGPGGPVATDIWPGGPEVLPPWPETHPGPIGPPGRGSGGRGSRRRIPLGLKWAAALIVIALIFRRAIASVALMALSAGFHLVGVNAHLPSVPFAWPWQTVAAGTATNTDLGPWVLQKIQGISKPALGEATFNFLFTHKVSKNIGPWPCWYASTFYAVAHASATVDLNPGPAWWASGQGHYQLQVLSRPEGGKPGHVAVTMVLPQPQLPQSVHDIAIDNVPSKPVETQHSWTYPGFGCGVVLRPQFPESVLYAQAQSIAFYKSQHAPQVTRPLVKTAEAMATQTIRNNFIQPTVNAFGYTLDRLTVRWAGAPPG
jgi:hypothetical protein